MPLDLTVSSTNLKYDNTLETFQPYDLGNGDDLMNINNEMLDKNDYEEVTDPEKYNVLDILNEMRLEEPLGDDINIEYHNNNDLPPFHNFNLVASTEDFSTYYSNTFNKNNVVDEHKAEDNNELDLLLYQESGSTPNVQLEVIDSTVQFKYDIAEQFDCAPDMELSYPDVSDSIVYAADVENNNVNDTKYKTSINETEPSQLFECSTNLPMTVMELEDDIKKTFNEDRNFCETFYESFDIMFNDSSNKRTEIENMYPYSSETLVNHLEADNPMPIVRNEIPTDAPVFNFQCDICSYMAKTKDGLSVHLRVHSIKRFKCQQCHYWTENRYSLKRHLRYNHQKKYICPRCSFFTRCSTRIKRHLRKRH